MDGHASMLLTANGVSLVRNAGYGGATPHSSTLLGTLNMQLSHLQYFWWVVKLGGVSAAATHLGITQPTVSVQLKKLEDDIGEKLIVRESGGQRLSITGQLVFRHCESIFRTLDELKDDLRGVQGQPKRVLKIGVADVFPKSLSYTVLSPIQGEASSPQIACFEDDAESLLRRLVMRDLDLVLSDAPIPPSIDAIAYNHKLFSSSVSVFAHRDLISSKKRQSLLQVLSANHLLLPTYHSVMRQELERWFSQYKVVPHEVSEFQDTAQMKIFGCRGWGVFLMPSIIQGEILSDRNVRCLGVLEDITLQYFLISTEKKIKRPEVARICERAKRFAI